MYLLLPILMLLFSGLLNSKNLPEFVVIITSYNNEHYYYRNLDSVIGQKLERPFGVIYIDDCSTDNTGKLVEKYIKNHNASSFVKVIHNQNRKGMLSNLYTVIHKLANNKIVVTVDGDDYLAHDKVLARVEKEYYSGQIWLTYGQYMYYPIGIIGVCSDLPECVLKNNSFRTHAWATSQLRTFYAGLFKHIKKDDLTYNNDFFSMAGDVAMFLPMLEMASRGHIKFIPDVLYLYELLNPLSDHNTNRSCQLFLDRVIRSKIPYTPLETLVF